MALSLVFLASACVQPSTGLGTGGTTGGSQGGAGGNSNGNGGTTGGSLGGTSGGSLGGSGAGSQGGTSGGSQGGNTGGGLGGNGQGGASGLGGTPANPDAGGRPDLTGRKALIIVDDPNSIDDGDALLKSLLEIRGMTVTFGPSAGPASLATGMHVVIGSSGASATEFGPVFKDVAVPMILFYNTYYVPMGFAAASGALKGNVPSTSQLTVTDISTPLASDFGMGATLSVIAPSRNTQLSWTAIGGAPIKVASVMGAPTQLIDFAFEKGAAMAVGTAAARRVALGWKTDAIKDLMLDSFKLQDAAVSWTAAAP